MQTNKKARTKKEKKDKKRISAIKTYRPLSHRSGRLEKSSFFDKFIIALTPSAECMITTPIEL